MRKFSYLALVMILAACLASGYSMRSVESDEGKGSAKGTSSRVASIDHIMSGIVRPAAKEIFAGGDLPGSTVEWKIAAENSALMNEASIMIVQNKRTRQGEWKSIARELHASSAAAYRAAIEKNDEKYEKARGRIKNTCKACHDIYRKH